MPSFRLDFCAEATDIVSFWDWKKDPLPLDHYCRTAHDAILGFHIWTPDHLPHLWIDTAEFTRTKDHFWFAVAQLSRFCDYSPVMCRLGELLTLPLGMWHEPKLRSKPLFPSAMPTKDCNLRANAHNLSNSSPTCATEWWSGRLGQGTVEQWKEILSCFCLLETAADAHTSCWYIRSLAADRSKTNEKCQDEDARGRSNSYRW